MSDKIRADARNIKKLIREAEALSEEAMIACARLKLAMVGARQNPEVAIDAGQRAIMRLNQAETNALAMSTSLLRVHEELNRVNREMAIGEEETNLTPSAFSEEAPAFAQA